MENKIDDVFKETEEKLKASYSKASDFDRNGPKALIEKTYVDNKGIMMGKIIDELLFSPSIFNDNYHIVQHERPKSTLGLLCDHILENHTTVPSTEEVISIIKNCEFWKSTSKEELIINKFNNDVFWEYLKENIDSVDKKKIPISYKTKADEIVYILKTHSFSKDIFDKKYQHIYQYKFEFEFQKIILRGYIDIVSIDHKKKIVYLKDLKTGINPNAKFIESFIKFRYYLQEAVYSLAFETICKDLNLKNYKLANFEFIYIGLNEKIPVVFKTTKKWHIAALKGFTFYNTKYKGLCQLSDEMHYHWKNKIFDKSLDLILNNGKINLEDNLINISN